MICHAALEVEMRFYKIGTSTCKRCPINTGGARKAIAIFAAKLRCLAGGESVDEVSALDSHAFYAGLKPRLRAVLGQRWGEAVISQGF